MAQGLLSLFMILGTVSNIHAQCEDFVAFPPNPIVINLTLNASGDVNLTNAILNANGFVKDAGCDYWLSDDPDPNNVGAYVNTPIRFSCSPPPTPTFSPGGVGTYILHVRVGGLPPNIGDSGGPGATVVDITVNVIDNILPTVMCPANQSVNTDPGQCSAVVAGLGATIGDNCMFPVDPLSWTLVSGPSLGAGTSTSSDVSGAVFSPGVSTIRYEVRDSSMNSATCQFTVTVTDNEDPVITCPADQSVSTDADKCGYAYVGLNATATDNCGTVTITNNITGTSSIVGHVFGTNPNGASLTTTVTWTVTAPGMTGMDMCDQMITVEDNVPPTFTSCPGNVTVIADGVTCDYTGTSALNPVATDHCSAVTYSNDYDASSTLDGKIFPLMGSPYMITWTATDAEGNSIANCTYTVTVIDTTAPSLTFMPSPPSLVAFQDNYEVFVAPGTCTQSVSWYRPSKETHTAMNCNGIVRLQEGTPVYEGTPLPTFFVDNGVTPYPYQTNYPGSYLMGNPLHATTPISAEFQVGTTVIPYIFSDTSGNETIVNVTVTVKENEPPVAKCLPGPISIPLDALGFAIVTPGAINDGSTDNCGIAGMSVSPNIFDCEDIATNSNMVVLTVEDLSGLTDTCHSKVFVLDNSLPLIGCPLPFTVAANADCEAKVNNLIFKSSLTPPTVGALEYFDNAVDPCGLTFEYKINSNPFQTYPGLIVSQNVDLSDETFPAGLNTVTIRAKDAYNNIGACTFTVNVVDQTAPFIEAPSICPADISTFVNPGGCITNVSWTPPVFKDNCTDPLTPAIYVNSSHLPGTFFGVGSTTVTYTAHDAAGNINNTCTFKVIVTDTFPPVANCKNATVTLGSGGTVIMQPMAIDNNSFDNCFYNYQSGPYSFNCDHVGTPQTVTLTIVDPGGKTASCQAMVTVLDGQAPVADCSNLPLFLDLSMSKPGQVTLDADTYGNAMDNCPDNVTYQVSVDGSAFVDMFDFDCSHIGTRMVTLKASDSAGSSTCGPVAIDIRDKAAPTFTAPAAQVVNCNSADPNVVHPSNTGFPTGIMDNCDDNPEVTYTDNVTNVLGCPNALSIIRTWTVTDHAVPPNSASATQNIQIQDITPPQWSLGTSFSTNTTGGMDCKVPSPIPAVLSVGSQANVQDACGSLTVTYGIVFPVGSVPATVPVGTPLPLDGMLTEMFPIGVSIVTFVAVDECSNASTRTVTVTVNDVDAPEFSYSRCGNTYTLPNTTNSCNQLFSWKRPNLDSLFDCKNYSVTEVIGNTSVQQFVNQINPFGSWPPASAVVTAQFPVGPTVITYTATDASNNTSTCSFTVLIEDTQAPSISCPPNQTLSITAGCTDITKIPDYTILANVVDNCPNNVIRLQDPMKDDLVSSVVPVVPGNSFTVTLKAMDSKAQMLMSAPCTFDVLLVDGDSPVPDTLQLSDIVSFCGKDTVTAPSATDCNGVSFVTIYGTPSVPVMMVLPPLVPGGPPRYVLNAGNYVITWSYTDAQNNTTTQPQNVSILVDVFPPTAICHADSVDLDAAGLATVFATELDNGSFDQDGCGPVTLSFRTGSNPFNYVPSLDFSCNQIGINAVVFAATDVNGNTSTCATTIKVKDVIAPQIANVPADITVEACNPIPAQAVLTATDICDSDVPVVPTETSTQSATNEDCGFYNYTITREWTATDDSGNTQTVTQIVTVIDTQAPVFSSPDSIVVLTDHDRLTCDDTVSLNMLDFLVDCAPDSELVVINNLNPALGANVTGIYSVGSHIITFTATDKCGNSSTKSIKLVVKDATLPTAVCINGISVSLQSGGTVSIGVNQINDNSFDNCGPPLAMQIQRLDPAGPLGNTVSFSCPDADGSTQHPVKLFVTDIHGNTSSCQTFVVVQDNVTPTITCPPNDTVSCEADMTPAALGTASATDNCPILVNAISYSDSIANGNGSICKVLVRTWMARDLAGNIASCDQLISIFDTVKPVLSAYPPDITITCSEPLPDPVLITATDNCSSNLDVTFQQDTIDIAAGVCGKYDYTIVRTRTATDSCGNTETHVRLMKVQDTIAPVFPAMPDTIVLNTANFPANLTCSVPVTLDLGQYFVDCALLSECTIDAITFDPALAITPSGLDISGDYPVGTTSVIISVTDPCGNQGVDTINVTVVDNSLPTLVCNDNVVVALGSNGDASIDPSDIDLGSTDNCAIDTLFLSVSTFDCADLGLNAVQLTAIDIHGNSNFCQVEVNVTLGSNAGFMLTTDGTPESFFGAGDGTVSSDATGGSGMFSYTWSTSDTTTMVNGLTAGTYTVTVIDASTGCVNIDTAVVEAGPKITINIGTEIGCQGQTVMIPITVDNFIEVNGFSMGLQLDSVAVGSIISISDVNPALVNPILNGTNSIFWTEPTLDGVTLQNGSILFILTVQLNNVPTPVGTFSPISISPLPALAFLQDLNGVPNPAGMIVINNGLVTIDCPANDIDIAGDIFTWGGVAMNPMPIPNVDVALTGTIMGADVTALPLAEYGFQVPSGANTVVTPSKVAAAKSTKINVGDLLFIQAHSVPPPIQIPFTSPYQWIAADINGDNMVNIIDYALVQAYIVNNAPTNGHFNFNPAPPDWKFVPKSYVFPAPNPLVPAPPSTIEHMNVTMPFLDDDFVGVLLGDVNGDVIPTLVGSGGTEFGGTFKFRLDDRSVQNGEVISVPFKALNFTQRQAYQLTIAFDADKFELVGIEPGVLSDLNDDNFGTGLLSEGLLSTLWVGGKPMTFANDEVLFTLKFKAHANVQAISELLSVSSEIAEAMAIDFNGNVDDIVFDFASSVGTNNLDNGVFALYQNQPNPFSAETSISFRLPEAGRAKLHIFGTDGRLIKTIIGDYAAGKNAVTVRKDELGGPGVYWYELETPRHSDRKKMILIN